MSIGEVPTAIVVVELSSPFTAVTFAAPKLATYIRFVTGFTTTVLDPSPVATELVLFVAPSITVTPDPGPLLAT